MKCLATFLAITAAAMVCFPWRSAAGTTDVFQLQVTLAGPATETGDDQVVSITRMLSTHLFNLALGRPDDTLLATNEVLGLVTDCQTNELRIIAFDRSSSSNLATIADLTVEGQAANPSRATVILTMSVNALGDATNGLAGGEFAVATKTTTSTNGCPTKVTGTLIGALDVTLGGTDFTILVPKGKLSTGTKVGTLVEP